MSLKSIALAKLVVAYERAVAVYFPAFTHEAADLASDHLAEEGIRYWLSPHGDAIVCTKCRMVSRNPEDVKNRYCGSCHAFMDDPDSGRSSVDAATG